MPTIDTTIMSSISVKPFAFHPPTLPILVLGTIERRLLALCHHVIDIFTAPTRRSRTVLVTTQRPIGFSRQWIDRHHSQIASHGGASHSRLLSRELYAQERIERLWIAVRPGDFLTDQLVLDTHR